MRTIRTILWLSLAGLAACGDAAEFQPGDAHYAVYGSSGSTVTVQWTPIEGATTVMLERGSSEDDLQPIATLDVGERGYLDTGLAPLTTYTYRFTVTTAAGVEVEPAQEARTTDDAILITGDATPLGAPVVTTVGAAGAAIAVAASDATVIVPPGAASDGTVVTIQPIASPYADDDSPGLSITASVPLTQPVEVAFAYDEIDALEPTNLTIITHADDGSWISQPRIIDPTARTVTLAMEVGTAAPALWAAPIRFHEAVKLRFTMVVPRSAKVKVGKTVGLQAYGFFSDDPCDVPVGEFGCSFLTAGLLGLGLVDAHDAMRPARQSAKPLANSAPNSERDWTVELIIGGSAAVGTVAKTGNLGAIYTAPAVKPASNPVAVRFTSVVTRPKRLAAQVVPAIITIEDESCFGERLPGPGQCIDEWHGGAEDTFIAPDGSGSIKIVADGLTWRSVVTGGGETIYELAAGGTVHYEMTDSNCTSISFAPDTVTFDPTATSESDLDYHWGDTPITFTGHGSMFWMTQMTMTCDGETSTIPQLVGGQFFRADVTQPTGMALADNYVLLDHHYVYSFHR